MGYLVGIALAGLAGAVAAGKVHLSATATGVLALLALGACCIIAEKLDGYRKP